MMMFDGFYQFGFVARDLDRACVMLGRRFGVTRFRRKRTSEWMESAHAWTGSTMIEVIGIGERAPALYADGLPQDAAAVRLHHHGYRLATCEDWEALNRHVDACGWATPMRGAVMEGQLNYLYVDTRADLGVYCEFVFLSGAATAIYDDVPQNDRGAMR